MFIFIYAFSTIFEGVQGRDGYVTDNEIRKYIIVEITFNAYNKQIFILN